MDIAGRGFKTNILAARFGISALCLLLIGFWVDFAVGGREDQYCFGPPVHNWAWHCGQISFFTMLVSVVLSVIALRIDQRKRYAVITLLCFMPLLLLDTIHEGCW